MAQNIDPEELRALTQRIIDSGELGRSKTYGAILSYLAECSIAGETPKETAIAVEVLGRETDFDVGKDSIVRVHIYHLRNKLATYFAKHGKQEKYVLEIPKGQYVISVHEKEESTRAEGARSITGKPMTRRNMTPWLAALVAILLVLNLFNEGEDATEDIAEPVARPHAEVLSESPWRAISDDQAPILVVVGDYYIFGELDETGNIRRMVREFDINSRDDLEGLFMLNPELADRYYNLGLSYLPTGTAGAMMHIMPLLYEHTERLSIKTMSRLNAADLANNHVIYLGYVSGLGILEERVFAASALQVGRSYDELRERESGSRYISDSGIRNTGGEFQDYGLVSTFPSPRGHQFILLAGLRDAGLIYIAQEVSRAGALQDLNETLGVAEEGEGVAWEALYEVYGLDRTNFDGQRVYAGSLDSERIWGG